MPVTPPVAFSIGTIGVGIGVICGCGKLLPSPKPMTSKSPSTDLSCPKCGTQDKLSTSIQRKTSSGWQICN